MQPPPTHRKSGSSSKSAAAAAAPPPPVYSLPHDAQVDLLAQALLREFMHKKGFKETMAAFDAECPRDERTISSRSVMAELMHLEGAAQANLKARGVETIMEMLCCLRTEKRERAAAVASLKQQLQEPLPEFGDGNDGDDADGAKKDKTAKKAKKEKLPKKGNDDGDGDAAAESAAKKAKKAKKGSKKTHKIMSIDELLEKDTPPAPAPKAIVKPLAAAVPTLNASVLATAAPLASATPSASNSPSAPIFRTSSGRTSPSSSGGSGSDNSSGSDKDDDDDYETMLRKLRDQQRAEQQQQQQRHTGDPPQRAKSGWDADAAPQPQPTTTGNAAAAATAATQPAPSQAVPALPPLPPDAVGPALARRLLDLFVGPDRALPQAFTAQGFTFSPDIEYGLLQHRGGPCGVLAVVQGFLLRELFKNHFIITDDARRGALCRALTHILLKIAPGGSSRAVKLATYGGGGDHADVFANATSERSRKQQIVHLSYLRVTAGFDDEQKLYTAVDAQLTDSFWCKPQGYGLVAFMTSCVLTRGGADAVESDMDIASPLIVEHGYCSQELTNLCLCGRACSNVHDDVITHGSVAMRGFAARLEVGFVSHLEHRGMVKVGDFAKKCVDPVWVLYNESHYTVMFMKADARGSDNFDLFYYDQQGGQTEEIRLSVKLDKFPLPAVGRNDLTPYLNDIVRTLPGCHLAKINWNGTEPLL